MNELSVIEKKLDDLHAAVYKKNDDRLENSLFAPDKAEHYQNLATQLASSELVPKQYRGKPKDLFLAWEQGFQLGFTLAQSMQDIAIINGKPAVYGDALLALVVSHPEFVDIKEEPIIKDNELFGYQCTVRRANRTPTIRSFTLEDAKKARLLGRPGPWTDYRDRMLQMRARGFACRDAFADRLKGIKSAEEYIIDGEYEDVTPSRAETIKSDYKHKQGGSTYDQKDDVAFKNMDNQKEASENEKQDKVDEVGSEADEVIDTNADHTLISLGSIQTINTLLKEKKFTKERKKKALEHYGLEDIQDMSENQAQNFIQQLEKA